MNRLFAYLCLVLVVTLLISFLPPPVGADEVEGSGEVTVKTLFELEPCFVWPSEVRIGEIVGVDVGIKNNDDKAREFNITVSIKGSNGIWRTVTQLFIEPSGESSRGVVSVTVGARETYFFTLYWTVDKSYEYGWYDVKIRVWTYEPRIDKTVVPSSPLHGFTVKRPGLQPFYQKKLRDA